MQILTSSSYRNATDDSTKALRTITNYDGSCKSSIVIYFNINRLTNQHKLQRKMHC